MPNTVTEILNPRIIINLYKDVQDVVQNTLGLEGIVHKKNLSQMLFSAFSFYLVWQSRLPSSALINY